jgi:PAS domain S-box-containing protein
VSDDDRTKDELIPELDTLRRRIADLECSAIEHQRTEHALQKEAYASEAALRKSDATAHALLESASESILLVNAAGRIILVNAAGERMFGYTRNELVGAELEVLLPERARAGHLDHRKRYFAGPRVRPMGIGLDLKARRRDGSEFPVEISLSYVESDEGTVAMAFITDITQRKRVEAELQRQREIVFHSEKLAALGRLAAGVVHEMNNPLGIISSRIEVMLLEAKDQQLPESLLADLRVLHRNTERVAKIARSLRSFARQAPGEHASVDLNAIVDDALILMEKPLAMNGIEVATVLDRTLPPILGDGNALHQVLLNLLTNAREAMVGRGQIRIETGRAEEPGHVRLVVTDTGPGIAPEDLPNIFDPFFTTKTDGTGLGLALSYGIIQDHHGTVDVQSDPGRGTTFIVTFPLPRAS